MTQRDARSLDPATLEELRRIAVKAVLSGESQRAVARRWEVHHPTVCKWLHWDRQEGDEGWASTKAPGPRRKLTARQGEVLRRIVLTKNPRQLTFEAAFGTLRLVGTLIERRLGVVLHHTTLARLLREMGIPPQVPVRRAFPRDEAACRRWMTEDCPKLVRFAHRKPAMWLFLDETGVPEDPPVGRTWGARGHTPIVPVSGRRRRAKVISAISARGQLWFRCDAGTLTATGYVEHLRALLADLRGPVVLVHDRHPAHTAASTRRFLVLLNKV